MPIMTLDQLIATIHSAPDELEFSDVIRAIDAAYDYRPVRFHNGTGSDTLTNEAGTNEGSCKIFAFGKLNGLDQAQTLACFGRYYRGDVLGHPERDDHANIRTFIRHGWDGIRFETNPLIPMT